jgi:starch synthase
MRERSSRSNMAAGSKGCCNVARKISSASLMGQITRFGIPDAHLPADFNLQNIAGKRVCKIALKAELGLEVDSKAALVVFVSRMTEQKMADVVAVALPRIIESGAQCAVVGDGDQLLEERFELAARHHPGRIAVRIGYQEPLAHRVLAGGDILLHPARFEPCGLTQLYAMRYGTLPVVRNTGGLCDTVVDAAERSVRQGVATGFAFETANGPPVIVLAITVAIVAVPSWAVRRVHFE